MNSEATATTTAPDFIQIELKKFNVTQAAIEEMVANYLSLKVADFNDKAGAKLVRERRLELKRLGVAIEKTRVELKAESLRFGRVVDAHAKCLSDPLKVGQDHLQQQEEIVTKHQERLEAEARAKEEAERKAREQAAAEERAKLDAERAKLDEERRQLEAEKARLEAERKHREEVERAALLAAEQAAFATEQRMKREAEEVIERERAEAARIARVEAARPDREKLLALANRIAALDMPAVEGVVAQGILEAARQKLVGVTSYLEAGAEAL